MSMKIKTDSISVEITAWDFKLEHLDTEAIVNPTDRRFSASGGLDKMIHKEAGWKLRTACMKFGKMDDGAVRVTDGYQLPFKKIIHAAVPQYHMENFPLMIQCYDSCIQAIALGENVCQSVTIPLLGTKSRGWAPKDSMHCAWSAILKYAEETSCGFSGVERLRKIVIVCDAADYSWIRDYRKNMGHMFFRTPEQFGTHGDLFFWSYLQKRLSKYTVSEAIPSAMGALRMTAKIVFELTGKALEKGKKISVIPMERFGKLAGMPLDCDFWLDTAIPLMLENFCLHHEKIGLPPIEIIDVLIGNHIWTIPKDCEPYLCSMRGETKLWVLKNTTAAEQKLLLKDTGLKYSPAVEKALKICFDAHKNQVDNSGLPYVFHPFHIAEQMETEDEICTALLHDVVEDSEYTLDDLKNAGFSQTVLDAVELLTHDPSVPYMDYVRKIRKNKVARKVKLADLTHNSDPNRRTPANEWERTRARRYRIAKAILEDDWYDHSLHHYRKIIPLDDKKLYYLSIFYEPDGTKKKYSLDVEAAADTHVEFKAGYDLILACKMGLKGSFPEALSEYLLTHSKYDFIDLLKKSSIEYKVFHYGD